MKCKFQTPLYDIQTKTITFPPPCLKVKILLFFLSLDLFYFQYLSLVFIVKSSNLHSSENMTFFQKEF